MKVLVNGEERELPVAATVAELVPSDSRWIAVAVDGEVVPRAAWPACALRDGQRIEIIAPKQGG